MTKRGPHYIAGTKTDEDWRNFRPLLLGAADAALWQTAFHEYLRERLRLRYLEPIAVLQANGTLQGEGFSIVAVQCTLIEFLESTVRGVRYRFTRKGEQLGEFEYSSSSQMFEDFLVSRRPFNIDFASRELAHEFYTAVRCGLLHEAQTKNGWRIWADGPTGHVIDADEKLVFRNNFQAALLAFIEAYGAELVSNTEYQQAFIRKFDSLCGAPPNSR